LIVFGQPVKLNFSTLNCNWQDKRRQTNSHLIYQTLRNLSMQFFAHFSSLPLIVRLEKSTTHEFAGGNRETATNELINNLSF
jgi:hypothetical protein